MKIYNGYFKLKELSKRTIGDYRELTGNDNDSIEEIINVISIAIQHSDEYEVTELISASPLSIGMIENPTEDMIFTLTNDWGDHFVRLLGQISNSDIIQSLINLDVQLLMYVSNNINCTLTEQQANEVVAYLESDDRTEEFDSDTMLDIFASSKRESWYRAITDMYKLAKI